MNPAERADATRPAAPLQLWGGIECSVVRVGDEWRDQIHETGHHERGTADIARIARMGLRTVRYPLLWERHDPPGTQATRWHDRQMASLHGHRIDVIAGLVHHGAGPAATSLLDPLFPERLAEHAGRMAERYPGVHSWIPVNEPLTTARFACLYGHWHPHQHDEGAFLRAVVNQCRATLLAIRAIRAHLPDARFVSTEDIGRVFARPALAGQAGYENDRRWLSLDLLCGTLGARHPWRGHLEAHGVPARHLDELATGEAAPDVVGVNHYATSDRFLDDRLDLYAPVMHRGNGQQAYVDTEAIRAGLADGATGWTARLREVWVRYGRPMAVTEVHLGCDDPAETVLWLMEAWQAAQTVRAEGAQCLAVTAWALFGLVDWDSLLCQRRGHYEPGAFDVRADPPAPLPVAAAIEALARDGAYGRPGFGRTRLVAAGGPCARRIARQPLPARFARARFARERRAAVKMQVAGANPRAGLPESALAFVVRHFRCRPALSLGLFAVVAGAALCAVGVQYGAEAAGGWHDSR